MNLNYKNTFIIRLFLMMALASIYPIFAAPFTRPEQYSKWFFDNLHFSIFPFIFSFAVTLFLLTFKAHTSFQGPNFKKAILILIFLLILSSFIWAIDTSGIKIGSVFKGNLFVIFIKACKNLYAEGWDFRFRKLWNTIAILFVTICFWHLLCLVAFKSKLNERNVRQVCLAVALIGFWFPARIYSVWVNNDLDKIKDYTALTVAAWSFAIAMLFSGILVKRLQGNDKKLYFFCVATPFALGQVFSLDNFLKFIPESFRHSHVGGKLVVIVLIVVMLAVVANEMDIGVKNTKKANKANPADVVG